MFAKVPGVTVEAVSVGEAVVALDPALTPPDALRDAIARAGYQPLPTLPAGPA